MKTFLACLAILLFSACSGEVIEAAVIAPPGLEGPLSEGRWEARGRKSMAFWPPTAETTRFPELLDFTCEEDTRGTVRMVITGDVTRNGLWIAMDGQSERPVLIETEAGVTELGFLAGDQLLPHRLVRTDAEWLAPFFEEGTRVGIAAFGHKSYQLEIPEGLGAVLRRCGSIEKK